MLYSINHITRDIKYHFKNNLSFSLVRLGDGDIKFLYGLLKGNSNSIKFDRSGIPYSKSKWVLKLYKNSCNLANYTSSFDVYYDKNFWNRKFSIGTNRKVKDWKELYKKIGIHNENFCNPEIGYLFFLETENNLLNILKNKKICLITCFDEIENKLKDRGFNVTSILIPKINDGHYDMYQKICNKIKKSINHVDIFLVGAGALGKGYSYVIKKNGGISIDIGQVMNYWAGYPIPSRLQGIIVPNRKDNLLFNLTKRYKKYLVHIMGVD